MGILGVFATLLCYMRDTALSISPKDGRGLTCGGISHACTSVLVKDSRESRIGLGQTVSLKERVEKNLF